MDWDWSMSVARSGYVLSERVRSVRERLSRSSCISPVAFVLSGGVDAAVDERGRRDLEDILLHYPYLQADSRIPKLLHLSSFSCPWKFQAPGSAGWHRMSDGFGIVGASGRGVG